MQWRESEFSLWFGLLYKKQEDFLFMQALMITNTFFDPKGTAKRLVEGKEVDAESVDTAELIRRAEAIINLPGSGSYQDKMRTEGSE